LVFLLVAYQVAAQTDSSVPVFLRVLLVLLFSLAAAHKTAVLTVSLPIDTPPPQNERVQRWLYVTAAGRPELLAMHLAEAFACISILLFWFLVGVLQWFYVIPYVALAALPVSKVVKDLPPECSCRRICTECCAVCGALPRLLASLCREYPDKFVHPLDAGLHCIIAVVLVVLCLACASNVPVLIVLWVHTVFLIGGLIDLHCIRRFAWRSGIPWWFALQVVALAAYVAITLCEFPKGIGYSSNKKHMLTNIIVELSALLWFILFTSLTLTINKEIVRQYFRVWQQRHGTFTLQVGGSDDRPMEQPLQPPV